MQNTTNQQLTGIVVMISPDQFGFNAEAAILGKNDWVHMPRNELKARDDALREFASMVKKLQYHDIEVIVLPSPSNSFTPDAVFPNNWFSHHLEGSFLGGRLVIYPMLLPTRQLERQTENLINALSKVGILNPELIDISSDENQGRILEGTGSLVLDRINKIAYALESVRTTKEEFDKWCKKMGYEGVFFHAIAKTTTGNNLYHTNIEMSIGDGFAVLCSDAITTDEERVMVESKLQEHGELIIISLEQMGKFCGNILQLRSLKGKTKIIMSQTAFDAFSLEQKKVLSKFGELVLVEIPTIEYVGGGSARCMLAEVFTPKK